MAYRRTSTAARGRSGFYTCVTQTVTYGVVTCIVVTLLLFAYYLPNDTKMSTNQAASEKGHRGEESRVIIVGGGLAGLSAAIEAYRHGAHVTIIDKEKNLGGNSAKATSGINAVNTHRQVEHSIADSIEAYVSDTLKSGDGLSNEQLVRILATESSDAILFLESFDLALSDVVQLGGHAIRRTHRFPPTKEGRAVPVGFTLISALKKYVESLSEKANDNVFSTINVITGAKFENLLYDDDAVAGLRYIDLATNKLMSLEGAVVLTSGGFANDHNKDSLLDRYVPKLARLPTTNGVWATGDILKYASSSKLSLIHMDKVQVHPTGFLEPSQPLAHTKFLAPEALRGCGAILVNHKGQRFADELGRRDYLTKKIFENCKTYKNEENNPIVAAMILTKSIIERFGAPLAGFYQFKKLITKVGSKSELGKYLNVPQATIDETIDNYNNVSITGNDVHGKKVFPATFSTEDEYYVAYITPSLHYCMGGLEIDQWARVRGVSKNVAGLYAAGEVTGGVHGNNRLGGNSLLECVVFGRRAGKQSAHYRRG